jgi:hypothetical protein
MPEVGENRNAGMLRNANHNVTAAPVVRIVGKSAYRCMFGSGFQLVLNSIRALSTTRLSGKSLIFIGSTMLISPFQQIYDHVCSHNCSHVKTVTQADRKYKRKQGILLEWRVR